MLAYSKPVKTARLMTTLRIATVLIWSQCFGGTSAKRTERMRPKPSARATETMRMSAPSRARQATKVMVEMPSSEAKRESTPSVP